MPTWELAPDLTLSRRGCASAERLGAVVTYASHGDLAEGFDAEWQWVDLLTVEGDLINRCEIFDEADLDAALARFDELQPPSSALENAASRVFERYLAHFAARDWDAMAEHAGRRLFQRRSPSGRERRESDTVEMPRSRTCGRSPTSGSRTSRRRVIATRGERLVLSRVTLLGSATGARGVRHRGARRRRDRRRRPDRRRVVVFDLDDIDAAFEELDARYLAGEAAAHAHTWSVIARAYAAFNRHEASRDDAGLGEHRPPASDRQSTPVS